MITGRNLKNFDIVFLETRSDFRFGRQELLLRQSIGFSNHRNDIHFILKRDKAIMDTKLSMTESLVTLAALSN